MSSQILNRPSLPIDPFLSSITDALESCASVIILAEPGAGKSTRVPVALMKSTQNQNGFWIMLQPRRWAAKLVAARIAEENQFKVGEEVGYQVRFENRTCARSRLVVMTEGVLLRRLLKDPELTQVKGVILDEFHERSIDLDLSLALLKELQESFRPDLKIVVMSATLDPVPLQKFLPESKYFEIPGRTFPVHKKFVGNTSVAKAISAAVQENNQGDGLVFLPGAYEIDRAIREVSEQNHGIEKEFDLLPLYSSLPESEQKRVFSETHKRKIIFSTNIAETSITLPKIKWVVDSGLSKVMRNDPQLGQDRLELLRISRASSEQRAGRAGRVSEGMCYRLWSEEENSQLRTNETPEIHRINLSACFLFLASYGVPDPEKFNWFEKPRSSAILFAQRELSDLGFVVEGKLTEDGNKAANIPLAPLFAKLKLVGERESALDFAARLAAFLEDSKQTNDITDWERLVRALNQLGTRTLQVAAQIAGTSTRPLSVSEAQKFEAVLIQALASRVFINERKVGRRVVRAQNKGAVLPTAGIILHSTEREEKGTPVILVKNFVPVSIESLKAAALKKRFLDWDSEGERVRAREGFYFQDLAVGNETDTSVKPGEAEQVLIDLIKKNPVLYFSRIDSFKDWYGRFEIWKKYTESSLEIPWDELIAGACQGKSKLSAVFEFPWRSYLESTQPELKVLERDLPEKIVVPTGNMIKIDYEASPPKLSVRLQEVFGWIDTPTVMQGKIPLLLELLSPGFKPIQLTRDLKSFWKTTYFEVKKELRARYPKHSWPDDPLTAKPEAKGRRRF